MTAAIDDAARLHRDAFVFDGHNDLALRILDGEDPAERLDGGHLDLPRMRAGGFDGGIFAVWIDPRAEDPLERTLRGVEHVRRWLEETPGVRPVFRSSDLEAADREGEIAAVIGVEGGYAITSGAATVERLSAAGMRCLTLTWVEPTGWIDAAAADPRHGGLTELGERVVARLEEEGVLVDVSHASDRATRRVLQVADAPVVASHSGVRSLADHPRNCPDDLLEGIAGTGGVLGINFFPAYLDTDWGRGFERVRERLEGEDLFGPAGRRALEAETSGLAPVDVGRIADHVERAITVAGAEHVGLGSDFDGVPALPEDMEDVRDLPRLTRTLLGRGIDGAALRGVLGANFRRVLEETLP